MSTATASADTRGRALTAVARPQVSDEQIERARSRKILEVAEDYNLGLIRRKNEYWASCCFHEENTPSLAFNPKKNVYHCHGCGAGGDVIDFVMAHDELEFVDAVEKLAGGPAPQATPKEPRRVVQTTRHRVPHSTDPSIVADHVRQDYSDGKKKMWWEPKGVIAADLALFGADEIGDADEVLTVEGEKAQRAARDVGIPAVGTVTGASGTPSDASLMPLVGKRIILGPDTDKVGRAHMDRIARRLIALGQPAERILVAEWTGAPEGGDIADLVAAGMPAAEIRVMLKAAAPWKVPEPEPAAASRLVIRPMSSVRSRETDWLWERWMPRGKLILFGGHAGDGKSTLLAEIAAIGSNGGHWPDGARAPRFRTLFLIGEDALDDTLRPRLDMLGADVGEVFAIETVLEEDGRERFFNLEKHLTLLESVVGEHRIDVLAIDPLTTIMPGRDRNAEGDTRDSLTPLVKFADRHNVAVVGVAHVGKPGQGQRTAAQRILGATAFHAMARVVWMTAPTKDGRMALGVVKSNLAMKPEALLWSRAEDGPIAWHGVSQQSVDDLLQDVAPSAKQADAEGFLRELLAAGSVASADVDRESKAAGIQYRTLRRAADAIGVKRWKEGGIDGRWFWRLPDGEPVYAESKLSNPIDSRLDRLHVEKDGHNKGGNLSNPVAAGQVLTTMPISEKKTASVGNGPHESNGIGTEVVQTQALRGGQVPNGHHPVAGPDALPDACLAPKQCGLLGLCARAPRCRTEVVSARTCVDCAKTLPSGWIGAYCEHHGGALANGLGVAP